MNTYLHTKMLLHSGLHYLPAVINIDMDQVYEKQNHMHACLRKLDYQKLFVLIITLSKKKEFQTKKKDRLLVFTRKVNVRAHPSVSHSFFFKDLKTWSNMIGLVWYVISNQLTFSKLRLVVFFLILSFICWNKFWHFFYNYITGFRRLDKSN